MVAPLVAPDRLTKKASFDSTLVSPLMSATGRNWSVVTAALLSVNVPAAGSVVIFTADSVSGGWSVGSLNPKSDAAKAYPVLAAIVMALSIPDGTSFTGVTFTVTVA